MTTNKIVSKFQQVPFSAHLLINMLIRLALIKYGNYMDATSEVPYTDIDYRVVTDGAMHLRNDSSPYLRHTYRYSPLLAMSVLPNLTLNPNFGKFLFACFDLLIGILIKAIICNEFKRTFLNNSKAVIHRINTKKAAQDANKQLLQEHILEGAITDKLSRKYEKVGEWSAYLWLYNPLTMVIGTRGNGDAISSCLVLASLYFLQLPKQGMANAFLSGVCHGVAIHLRLYPIFFSLAYFLVLAQKPVDSVTDFFKAVLRPNRKQIALVLGTVSSLAAVTGYFYQKYGFEFLYETYIYHLERKDTRHNFSLFFYMQYLTSAEAASFTGFPVLDKLLIGAPSLAIILCLTFSLGTHFKTLPFCLFAQTFVMVAYNSVVTSQYFIWYLSLLPLCLKNLKRVGRGTAAAYVILWFLSQGGWLLPAYFLEFKGWNTFDLIWVQSLMLFSGNVFILQRLVTNFDVLCDFNAFFEAKKKM